MSESLPILIAGGGIGGLTAALALARRGIPVRVFEQAPALGEVGAGVQISSNGNRVLFDLGLEDALTDVAWVPPGKEVRLWNTGESWPLHDVGLESVARYGAPFFMYHRADLHTALVDGLRAVAPDAVTLNATASGFDQDGDGVTLKLADGDTITGRALVGADGVHSAVRRTLFGPDDPQFTGIMVWRGLIPADRLPPDRIRQLGTNWMGPGAHVVHYFLRRGEMLNFVGAKERDDWQVESWSTRGTHEECLADFAGWHDDILTMIKLIDVPYKWALMMRPAMTAWSAGRVTLLGDACHPTLPFMAQGACMAIEDGLVLARCAEAFDDIENAFQHYEAARLDRTSRIVEGANDNAKRFHNPALATRDGAIDYLSTQFDPSRISDRYDWVFEYDAAAVEI